MDLTSSSKAKFGARFSQVHQIRGKIWEVLLPQDAKFGKESQFWRHLGLYLKFKGQNLGYLSPIFLEGKFGAPTRISEANFGAKPPDLLIRKFTLWDHLPSLVQTIMKHVTCSKMPKNMVETNVSPPTLSLLHIQTCIYCDTGMCHHFGYFLWQCSRILGIFLYCSRIFGYHFFGKIYLFRNHPDFWVLIWIFNQLRCRMLPAGPLFLIFFS